MIFFVGKIAFGQILVQCQSDMMVIGWAGVLGTGRKGVGAGAGRAGAGVGCCLARGALAGVGCSGTRWFRVIGSQRCINGLENLCIRVVKEP